MKKHVLSLFALIFLALGFSFSSAQAQSHYSQEDLDAILAPIALYPDELLSQVLIASTYPDDVHDARVYLDRYPSLQESGALLANQVAAADWDDSVKSLSQFPSVLAMLDDQPDWEDALGYAFLNQQDDVMQTVQRLRMRAERAGYLKTNSQQIVDVQRNIIVILPVRDNFYYVPYYDPQIVYGRWWWPNTQPYYWDPPPRYRPAGYALVNGFFFGASIGVLNSIFHPVRPDWHHHHIIIIGGNKPGGHWQWKPRPGYTNRPGKPNRPPVVKPPVKPRPPRPVPPKPGKPEIQPPKPGIPGRPQPPRPGRPEIQPPKPGNPGTPGRPGKPEVQPPRPTPGGPGILPVRPKPPETKPVTPPVTRPMPTRPVVTPPVVKPAQPVTRPQPARPATRPAPNKPDREKPDDKDDRRDRRAPG